MRKRWVRYAHSVAWAETCRKGSDMTEAEMRALMESAIKDACSGKMQWKQCLGIAALAEKRLAPLRLRIREAHLRFEMAKAMHLIGPGDQAILPTLDEMDAAVQQRRIKAA